MWLLLPRFLPFMCGWLVPNGVSLGVAPPASSGVATHLPPAPIPMSIDPSAFSTQDTPMEEGA